MHLLTYLYLKTRYYRQNAPMLLANLKKCQINFNLCLC